MCLYPVILKVSGSAALLKGREKRLELSRLAKKSAALSAARSNLIVHEFNKDDAGIPVASAGVFWSISHKNDAVAGVVSRQPVGIDIERIKDISHSLFQRLVSHRENDLFESENKTDVFFRVFTAKESVLKETGVGIKGLSKVKVEKVPDKKNLVLTFRNCKYWVENFYLDGYLASVTKNRFDVRWTIGNNK